jgi:hypothetical protein
MTIKINHRTCDTLTLYKRSVTEEQRALAGYIIRSGKVNDPILGGAFYVLCNIQRCNEENEVYELYNLLTNAEKRKVLDYVQMAMNGKFDKFMVTVVECRNMVKCLAEPM